MPYTLPEDIQPKWLSIVRRLQSVAKSNGLSILSLTIVVDADGNPVFWLSPQKYTIEPGSSAEEILATLAAYGAKKL